MAWGHSPSKYVVQAVKNCQLHLTENLNGKYLIPARADNPFPVDCDSSTDLSDILDPECSSFYQHLIPATVMSSQRAPRELPESS
jgi:hypothetical protein